MFEPFGITSKGSGESVKPTKLPGAPRPNPCEGAAPRPRELAAAPPRQGTCPCTPPPPSWRPPVAASLRPRPHADGIMTKSVDRHAVATTPPRGTEAEAPHRSGGPTATQFLESPPQFGTSEVVKLHKKFGYPRAEILRTCSQGAVVSIYGCTKLWRK